MWAGRKHTAPRQFATSVSGTSLGGHGGRWRGRSSGSGVRFKPRNRKILTQPVPVHLAQPQTTYCLTSGD
eukprot:6059284-Prymnesium_polylepis.1